MTLTFAQAAEQLAVAKIAESAATQARIDAENLLISMLPQGMVKDEGSVTYRDGPFKATFTFKVNRTVDEAALESVRAAMPAALFDNAFRYRPEIHLSGLRYLQNNEPEVYAIASQAITAKPGKTAVAIERVAPERAAA